MAMLTRYTPAAAECAGLTRMQATRTAASSLGLEHLAMSLLDMSRTLFGWLSEEETEGEEVEGSSQRMAFGGALGLAFRREHWTISPEVAIWGIAVALGALSLAGCAPLVVQQGARTVRPGSTSAQ